ncbi:nuclear transport factor 2 family protein [Sphingomonas sp.]|uniref:YybH family protein n=1 Tax=Sphingomonas sp. TaxID=28214 RepID=UPI0031D80A26
MILSRFFAIFAAGAATTATLGAFGALAQVGPDPRVAELADRAAQAHASLMRGDIARYRSVMPIASDFTLMDPFGGKPTGTPASDAHWQRIGRFFRDGRDARFDLIRAYHAPDLVVLVANEYAHVAVGSLAAQDWSLRVTLVFRRHEDGWQLVHRHADPLVKGVSLERAAQLTLGRFAHMTGA